MYDGKLVNIVNLVFTKIFSINVINFNILLFYSSASIVVLKHNNF